jgi:hypothetical protein
MISNIFARRTAHSKAAEELAEAEVDLLTAQTNAEYWDSQVAYNTSRVERLKDFLGVERYAGEGPEEAR